MIDEALYEQSLERERRRKVFDRLSFAALVATLLLLPFYGLMTLLEVDREWRWPAAIVAAPLFVAVVGLVVRVFGRVGAGTAMAFLNPGRANKSTVASALRAEANLCLAPDGDPQRAKELLQRLRKVSDATRADELFATHRLIDLYLGPLQDRDRGMSELRRLADRFPGTPDAQGALTALASLRDQPPPSEPTA
ncbi:MAG: hypothetical protein IBJ03_16655 [Gemmatimonadaceae bacterium]|nr:hypothetical protein [Gemmatimonadaceae bacterium]